MSLPLLVNGAECGPINPLQGLSKRFDQDRGIQQDHFGAGRAGPSRESFRSQYSAAANVNQDAAQFFSTTPSSSSVAAGPSAFDLAALHTSLPASQPQSPAALTPQRHTPFSSTSWASDFLLQPGKQSPVAQLSTGAVTQTQTTPVLQVQPEQLSPNGSTSNFRPWSTSPMGYRMNSFTPMAAPFTMPVHNPDLVSQVDVSQWDRAFDSQETNLSVPEAAAHQALAEAEQQAHDKSHHEADELARTAGRLIETVRDEQNPKFKNSAFLGLMRQLRDGEVVVEGDEMVPRDPDSSVTASAESWASDFRTSVDGKGKGRAVEFPTSSHMGPTSALQPQPSLASFPDIRTDRVNIVDSTANQRYEESPIDTYLREENEDYIESQRQMSPTASRFGAANMNPSHTVSQQDADWGRLQRDWDLFEATATGIRPLAQYQFQPNNPYLLGEASRTRHHSMHSDSNSSLFENVLELEAAVQRDSTNAMRWFELGVKQQENEREQKAVQALRRALELDPSHLQSWLALAVSYTNEGNRRGAYAAIREWVDRNARYSLTVWQFRTLNPETEDMVQSERFTNLVQCLISVARSDTGGTIDADTQIALAILLNTSEEYAKAQDCFTTALAVRPDDWLLYNRVGATLANNGNPEDALQYYYRALELNPAYIRARFNLGISCINLRRYEEASHHILDALVLQDGDSVYERTGNGDKRGVTSHALWESLKTCCLHMQRIDLATLCDREDLEAFRLNFLM